MDWAGLSQADWARLQAQSSLAEIKLRPKPSPVSLAMWTGLGLAKLTGLGLAKLTGLGLAKLTGLGFGLNLIWARLDWALALLILSPTRVIKNKGRQNALHGF